MRVNVFAATLLAAAALAARPASANELIGRFEKWEAIVGGSGNDGFCMIAALPAKTEGKPAKRGQATLIVVHFPRRKAFGQVQVKAGLALKKDASVELAVGPKTFRLVADGDSAYGENAKENAEIVAALKAGKTATATGLPATGVPAAGPKLVDTYPLEGFSAALAAIDKECGRK